MADMATQNRDAETSASVGRDNKAREQDERDDPSTILPCPAQNESISMYFVRLDEWRRQLQEGENKIPTEKKEGETDAAFSQRLLAWFQWKKAIDKRVEHAKAEQAKQLEIEKHAKAEQAKQLEIEKQELEIEKHAKAEQAKQLEIEKQKLETEKQKLETEKQKLVTENQQLDENGSVQELLKTYSGLPTMQRNTQAEPSIRKNPNGKRENESNNVVEGEDKPNKKCKSFHKNATIKKLDPHNISSLFNEFKVNLMEKDSNGISRLVKSALAAWMGKDRVDNSAKLSNFNESSPSLYIIHVLKDVIHCLGLRAEVAQEMSFFSMRPDIVVLKYMDVIVLVIEVKNEGRNVMDVMSSGAAAGQALDYGFGLKQLGIDVPIVCLSTYSRMRIGSTEKSIKTILDKTVERLKGVDADNPFGRSVNQQQKPEPSPAKKGNASEVVPKDTATKEEVDIEETETPPEETMNDDNRVIYMSEPFELKTMFKALYIAVACGCVAAEEAQSANGDTSNPKADLIPKEGDLLKDTWFNVVQKDSYTWTKVSQVKATYTLKTCWEHTTKVYMRCVLGMGRHGKVYLCMDSGGKHFAVKMLFYDSEIMESFDPERNVTKREILMEKLKNELEEEARRWREIYPKYKNSIWEGTLNEVPCLAMPYVASIPAGKREELIPEITDEMERLARQGYVYNKSDIRWRHVGLRIDGDGNKKIVFVDMGSLEKVEPMKEGSELEKKVEEVMNDMKRRMK